MYNSVMRELSKSIPRRSRDPLFFGTFFAGNAIDIGGAPDPLSMYTSFFPKIDSVKVWDLVDGDAQYMATCENSSFDLVHSSHCLEHMQDPWIALENWYRILKPGGHLVVLVPDEDLYEQGLFPSAFNSDHKWTFTIKKNGSWSAKSCNVFDLASHLSNLGANILKISLEFSGYQGGWPRYDQSLLPTTECSIELVVSKPPTEMSHIQQPNEQVRRILNQYKLDFQNLKKQNQSDAPFQDSSEI